MARLLEPASPNQLSLYDEAFDMLPLVDLDIVNQLLTSQKAALAFHLYLKLKKEGKPIKADEVGNRFDVGRYTVNLIKSMHKHDPYMAELFRDGLVSQNYARKWCYLPDKERDEISRGVKNLERKKIHTFLSTRLKNPSVDVSSAATKIGALIQRETIGFNPKQLSKFKEYIDQEMEDW